MNLCRCKITGDFNRARVIRGSIGGMEIDSVLISVGGLFISPLHFIGIRRVIELSVLLLLRAGKSKCAK